MRRFLSLGVLLALIGCSSAPDKPSPTPLKRITKIVEIDDVESTSLGGGDQTGLSPAVHGDSIAAASAGGDVYLFDAKLDELWNTDIDRTILGGVALNSTAVYVATSDATLVALSRKKGRSSLKSHYRVIRPYPRSRRIQWFSSKPRSVS